MQFVAADGAGEGVAELAFDPVEDADGAFLGELEGSLAAGGFAGDVEGQALAVGGAVHEEGDGAVAAGQEAAADEVVAGMGKGRGAHGGAEALGEPGDQGFFVVAADFDGAAHVGGVDGVGDGGALGVAAGGAVGYGGGQYGLQVAGVHGAARHPGAAGADDGDGGTGSDGAPGQAARGGRERQAQGQGFIQHRVQQGVQGAALGLPGVHARQVLRMGR
ncbi:Uncharacterised protein [Achromobacter xylosoxidans]|nr:Uncharacterised protein [Achromobacter xylosoxidans]